MAEAAAIPSLGGYDEEFVNAVEEDFHCPICQLPLKEAVQTSVCGHRFCRQCLDGHFMRLERGGNPLSCPVDRNNLIRDKDIFPDKATQRKILSLIIKCPCECQWTGELRSKDDHLASCPLKGVACTNENCHVTLMRKDLELHVNTTCQWRLLCCDHCSLFHPACKAETHQQECRRFPLNCPEGCGVVIAREEVATHIEKDCVMAIISCPYAQLGCTEKVQRGDVEHHLQNDMRLHLDLTSVKLNKTEEHLRKTQEEFHDAQKKFEEITRKLEEKVIALENSVMQCGEEHTWKISGFSEILRQTKTGEQNEIHSTPFYTAQNGYKFKIRLYPNGSSSGKNTHLSVYFVMLKGEYDPILPWPFIKQVTITLIDQQEDQNDKENISASLPAHTNDKRWNAKPTTDENLGMGFAKFVSHERLRERRFIVDDTIFMRVKIVSPEHPVFHQNTQLDQMMID